MIPVKNKFSHLGFSMLFYIAISNIVGVLFGVIYSVIVMFSYISARMTGPSLFDDPAAFSSIMDMMGSDSFAYILATTLPGYLIATPLTLLLLNMPKYRDVPLKTLTFMTPYEQSEKRNLTPWEFLGFFTVTISFGVIGSLIASFISWLFSVIFHFEMGNALESFIGSMSLPQILLLTVIMAPIFEELVYRYGLVGYIRRYGEWNSIFICALVFGLIHTNLFQFFYAFLLGGVFAYVYIYTRQIKYTIALHILFNFFGAFVPMWISPDGSASTAYTLFAIAQFVVAAIGLAVFIVYVKKGKLIKNSPGAPIQAAFNKDSILNPGMICLFIVCIIITVVFQMTLFGAS